MQTNTTEESNNAPIWQETDKFKTIHTKKPRIKHQISNKKRKAIGKATALQVPVTTRQKQKTLMRNKYDQEITIRQRHGAKSSENTESDQSRKQQT